MTRIGRLRLLCKVKRFVRGHSRKFAIVGCALSFFWMVFAGCWVLHSASSTVSEGDVAFLALSLVFGAPICMACLAYI